MKRNKDKNKKDGKSLKGLYAWIMKSEAGEWEIVSVIEITNPLVLRDVELGLKIGHDVFVVGIILRILTWRWGFPPITKGMDELRDLWGRSRIVRISDVREIKNWKVSSYVKRLGLKKVPVFLI